MIELLIVPDHLVARKAGFTANNRHPACPFLMAWWPEAGTNALLGLTFHQVTIDPRAVIWDDQEAFIMARMGRDKPGIWIDLR